MKKISKKCDRKMKIVLKHNENKLDDVVDKKMDPFSKEKSSVAHVYTSPLLFYSCFS